MSIELSSDVLWRPYLRECYRRAARESHDPRTQNGSLLLTLMGPVSGANRFPRGLAVSPERLRPEIKGPLIVHAEEDAIFNAGFHGWGTDGATLVCCWAPCIRCAKAIIQSGITTVVSHKQMHDRTYDKYLAEIETAVGYLEEAGVRVLRYDGKIGDCVNIMNGETWEP